MSTCAICFEDIEVAKTGRTTLSCAHDFHYSCLTRWFISSIDAQGEPSCPCCRKKMDGLENYPEHEGEDEDEDDDEDDEEEDELYFTFSQLKAFIRFRGGSGLAKSYWMSIRNMVLLHHVCFSSIGELNDVLTDHRANPIAAGEYDTWDEYLPHDPYRRPAGVPSLQRNIVSVHLIDNGAWATEVANPEADTGVSVCLPRDETAAAGTVAHLLAKKIQKTWKASRITVLAEAMNVQEEDESWFTQQQQPIALETLEAQLMSA